MLIVVQPIYLQSEQLLWSIRSCVQFQFVSLPRSYSDRLFKAIGIGNLDGEFGGKCAVCWRTDNRHAEMGPSYRPVTANLIKARVSQQVRALCAGRLR